MAETSAKVGVEEQPTSKEPAAAATCAAPLDPATKEEWYREMKPGILHPRTSSFVAHWDMVVGTALIFTALVTPYEVAYLSVKLNALFVLNRLIDLIFLFDIIVNFRLAYFSTRRKKWIVDRQSIRRHYLHGWFTLDAVSTLPFDLIDIIVEGAEGQVKNEKGGASQLKILRVLKILKLFKLVKIVKSARIVKHVQQWLGLSNANSILMKHLLVFVAVIHWVSCLWGIGPSFEPESHTTWIEEHGHEGKGAFGLYLLGLYFSVQSMVMGETESTMPVTDFERLLSILCFMVGGSVYAYVIGSVCNIISDRDPATRKYHEMCDAVQQFKYEHHLPSDLGFRVQEYFLNTETMFKNRVYQETLNEMAPTLQREIANYMNGAWLKEVPFFNTHDPKEQTDFVAAISLLLEPCAFPPTDIICMVGHLAKSMHLVTKGLATVAGSGLNQMLKDGAYCGEESIMTNAVYSKTVRTITYVHSHRLRRKSLFECLHDNPKRFRQTALLVRRTSAKMALKLCMLSAYQLQCAELGLQPLSRQQRKDYRKTLRLSAANKKLLREQRLEEEEDAMTPRHTHKAKAAPVVKPDLEENAEEDAGERTARELDLLAQHTTPHLAAWFQVRAQVIASTPRQRFADTVKNAAAAAGKPIVTAEHAPLLGKVIQRIRTRRASIFTNVEFKGEQPSPAGDVSVVDKLSVLDERTAKLERMLGILLEHSGISQASLSERPALAKKSSWASKRSLLPALSKQSQQPDPGTSQGNADASTAADGQAKNVLELNGQETGELHFDCMGTYKEQDDVVGGQKVFRLDNNEDRYLYFCEGHGSWYLYNAEAMRAGLATGWLRCDSTSSPDDATAQWFVGDGTQWIEVAKIKARRLQC